MTGLIKAGWFLGGALGVLVLACGGEGESEAPDSGAPTDASTPKDASGDEPRDAGGDGGGDGGRDGGRDAATEDVDAGFGDAGPGDANVQDPSSQDASAQDASVQDASAPWTVVDLSTAAEVPPCASAGPAASGQAYLQKHEWMGGWVLYVSSVSWQNLSSPLTMAHIHFGATGANGPIVLPFPSLTPLSTSFTAMEYLAAPGAPISFNAFKPELEAGKAYINLHTQNCPGGELRGQIILP